MLWTATADFIASFPLRETPPPPRGEGPSRLGRRSSHLTCT